MTVTIPDTVYEQVQAIANKTNSPVDQVMADMLSQNLRQFPQHKNQDKMREEVAAYERLHPQLVKLYFGQHVAIFQGECVDHDPDPEALLLRVKKTYPNQIVLRRLVEKTPSKELVFRSPKIN